MKVVEPQEPKSHGDVSGEATPQFPLIPPPPAPQTPVNAHIPPPAPQQIPPQAHQHPQMPNPPQGYPVSPAPVPQVPVLPQPQATYPEQPVQHSYPVQQAHPQAYAQDAYAPAPPHMPPLPPAPPRNPAAVAYIRAIFSPRGFATLGWIAGAVFAAGLLSALCLLGSLNAAGEGVGGALSLDFGGLLSALFVLLGGSFGGGLVVDGNVDAGFVSASAAAALSIFPLGALAAVAAAVALITKLRMRSEMPPAPSTLTELARAAIEGAAVALIMTMITGFASFGGGVSDFIGVRIHARPAMVFFVLLALITVTLFLARESRRRLQLAQAEGRWARVIREAGRALAVQGTIFGVLALVAIVIVAVKAESFGAFFALLPLLGNVAAAGAALGHFGGITLGSSLGIGQLGMAWDLMGGLSIVLFVVALLSLVMTAGVVGLRRPRTGRLEWNRVWQMPIVVFGVWCLLSLGLVGISLSGSASSFGGLFGFGSVGLSWSTPFLMGLAAGATSIAAEYVPLLAYRMNPALLRAFGGKQTINVWLYGVEPAGYVAAPALSPFPDPAQPHVVTAPSAASVSEQPVLQPPVHGAPAAETPQFQDPMVQNPMAASPQAGGLAPIHPPAPMSKKGKTGLIVTLSVVGMLVVLGGGLAVTVNLLNQERDPAAQVREYLDALAAGNADRAGELVDPGIKTGDRELLTNETLASAQQLIEVVDVETTERSDYGATVLATYSLDGERFEYTFTLESGPKEMVFLDSWKLSQPLLVEASLQSDSLDVLTVGASDVSLDGDDTYGMNYQRTVYLYPGVYEITAPETEFIGTSTEEFRAIPSFEYGNASAQTVRITSTPSEAFEKEVLSQVQKRITQCVEIPTNMDKVCPSITRDKDLAELKVVSQAKDFESISLDSFRGAEAVIAVRSNPTSYNKDPELRESTLRVRGDIEIVDGKPEIKDISIDTGWW
ncbi:hypothetical protein G7067_03015 [Leucobacter insecticola]|uniref:Uncharacterized protein n=1 Tax=Leucobacter insecticola TaxID=2714934 RepID=A0A6G8FGM9_9MICO|nr:hypothetical protein [Leucobacter insecticola]QIM15620.1 hypothetical protein G7067_03015 [Leucobacter insecticola]